MRTCRLDIDWEYPGDLARGGTTGDKANLAAFFRGEEGQLSAGAECGPSEQERQARLKSLLLHLSCLLPLLGARPAMHRPPPCTYTGTFHPAEFKAEVARRGKSYLLTMATGAGPSGWQGAPGGRACACLPGWLA